MANNATGKIIKMSQSEVHSIGDYYIHNNWKNFDAYFQSNKTSHLKEISKAVNKEVLETTLEHISTLEKRAKKFAKELTGKEDLRTALEEMAEIYKRWSDKKTKEILIPMSNLKNIAVKTNKDFFEKISKEKGNQKEIKNLFDGFKNQTVAFLNAVSSLIEKKIIGEKSKASILGKKIENKILKNIMKLEEAKEKGGVAEIFLEEYKNIEEYLTKAFNTETPTGEDLKNLKKILIGTTIRRGTEQFSNFLYINFGFLFEHILAESYLKAVTEAFEKKLEGKNVDFGAEGTEFHKYAVSDIFIKIDDLKVGFSIKHELSGTSESKYEIDESGLFYGIKKDLLNEYLYLKNNSMAFIKTAKTEAKKNIDILKSAQFEIIKNRYLGRIFDGLYKETIENTLEIEYFGSQHALITPTIFWIDGKRIFYTHDIMKSILEEETKWKGRGEYKQDFKGLTLRAPSYEEKKFGLSRYKLDKLKQEKEKFIEDKIKAMSEVTFKGIGEELRETMIELTSKYPKLFFKKIHFLFKFSELEGKRGIAIPLKG